MVKNKIYLQMNAHIFYITPENGPLRNLVSRASDNPIPKRYWSKFITVSLHDDSRKISGVYKSAIEGKKTFSPAFPTLNWSPLATSDMRSDQRKLYGAPTASLENSPQKKGMHAVVHRFFSIVFEDFVRLDFSRSKFSCLRWTTFLFSEGRYMAFL